MADLIDREALNKWCHDTMKAQTTITGMACIRMFWTAVNAIPTITSESLVRHGKWEEVEDPGGGNHWRCSSCGIEWYFEADGPVENGINYCSNCGCKMDLEERYAESNH